MAILVTGGTGFVGLNLVEALLARGDSVAILSNGPLPPQASPVLSKTVGHRSLGRWRAHQLTRTALAD